MRVRDGDWIVELVHELELVLSEAVLVIGWTAKTAANDSITSTSRRKAATFDNGARLFWKAGRESGWCGASAASNASSNRFGEVALG
jgi:hypothetical protein